MECDAGWERGALLGAARRQEVTSRGFGLGPNLSGESGSCVIKSLEKSGSGLGGP